MGSDDSGAKIVALEPGNAIAHKERSEALVGAGDCIAASESMARAFELAPDDPEIRASHGCNQAMRAESDEERAAALALIASSVERDAHDPEAWARAAYCFYRTAHGKAEAVRFITRAIELAPDVLDYVERAARARGRGAHARALHGRGPRAGPPPASLGAARGAPPHGGPVTLRRPSRSFSGD
jgi:tetratricopeptide (TPR) repeat protein